MLALYKGKEATAWKDIIFVKQGDSSQILDGYSGRDQDYILWWVLDLSKVPEVYGQDNIDGLFREFFSKDYRNINYHADFVVGFHDDVAQDRSWGILQ